MTNATSESNEPAKKAPRKGSKVAKRIAELESDYAVALAGGNADEATRLRACITRLESGESEEAPVDTEVPLPDEAGDIAASAAEPATTWNDVVAASVEAEANRVTTEQTFDKILVDLTPEERAELGAEHVAADAELAELTDEKKEAMADFKARIAKVESKKREIADAITKKKAWRAAPTEGWICEETFATNTRVYRDPKTGAIVCTEAMSAADRELALPKVAEPASKAAQMSLGDVTPTDDTAMTDPESLLKAAQEGDAIEAESKAIEEDDDDDLSDDEVEED